PQFYLRLWSMDGKSVWVYKTLVANENVPIWEEKSIRKIAFRRHLYTQLNDSSESDEFEHWINREFEIPASLVIQKFLNNSRLTSGDWHILIKFLAAQDVRTPLSYIKSINSSQEYLPGLLQKVTAEAVKKLETAQKAGLSLPHISEDHSSPLPLRVTKHIK